MQKITDGVTPEDTTKFAFFKGVNDAAVDAAKQNIQAVVLAGTLKTDGMYRICTLSGSGQHAPHIMPVLQRGPQDDCVRVNVVNTGAVAAGGGNANATGGANAGGKNGGKEQNGGTNSGGGKNKKGN
jgi:transcription initiation factor TFIID subunit 15